MAQYLSPSGAIANETGSFQALTPNGEILNESASAGGTTDAAFSIVPSATLVAAGRSTASGAARPQASLGVLWSSSSVSNVVSAALNFAGTAGLSWVPNVQNVSVQLLTPDGAILNETSSYEFLLPTGSIVNESQSGQSVSGQSDFGISAAAIASWASGTSLAGSANFAPSTGFLWQGESLSTAGAFSLACSLTVDWRVGFGAAFYILDDQTTVTATGASIANAEVIVSAAGTVQWSPTQVPTDTAFAFSAALSSAFEAVGTVSSNVSILSAATASWAPGDITASADVDANSGSSLTFDSLTIEPNQPFIIEAAAFIQWNSLDSIFEGRDLQIDAGSLLQFTSQALGPEPTELSITSDSLLRWSSVAAVVDDDDESEDDRRRIWAGAAEAEREALARRVYDEEELALFSAALAGAYAQYRKGLQ